MIKSIGKQKIPINLKIVGARSDVSDDDPSANDIFVSPAADMEFPSPLAVIESVAVIQAVIPTPGQYRCELYAGDKMLMARRLLAVDPTIMGGFSDG